MTEFDPAEQAVAKAKETAAGLGVRLRTEVKGREEFALGEGQWDLIVLSYVSFPEQAAVVARALRPGGVAVVEAFHRDATKNGSIGGGVVSDTGEIPVIFPGLRVVRCQEPMAVTDFGKRRERVVQYCGERVGE